MLALWLIILAGCWLPWTSSLTPAESSYNSLRRYESHLPLQHLQTVNRSWHAYRLTTSHKLRLWSHPALAEAFNQLLFTAPAPGLTEYQLRKGISYRGSFHRLRAVVKKLLSGAPVHIGVIGASVTCGVGASGLSKTWFHMFASHISTAFPKSNVTFYNGGLGGTSSNYYAICVDTYVKPEADLVLLEFNVSAANLACTGPRAHCRMHVAAHKMTWRVVFHTATEGAWSGRLRCCSLYVLDSCSNSVVHARLCPNRCPKERQEERGRMNARCTVIRGSQWN